MKPRVTYVVFDCADPGSLAAFWMEALGYEKKSGGDAWVEIVDPAGTGPGLFFQRVPEPKAVKNRVHIDLRHDDVPAEIERLCTLGARKGPVQAHEDLTVLLDPEGNEFCIYGGM